MKAITWIAIVLTLLASVYLGEKAYGYYAVWKAEQQIRSTAILSCTKDYVENGGVEWSTMDKETAEFLLDLYVDMCEDEYDGVPYEYND